MPRDLDAVIERAFELVGPAWPLDRAVAVNPLLKVTSREFTEAVDALAGRLGVSLYPNESHLAEARRRGLLDETAAPGSSNQIRPGTVLERHVGLNATRAREVRTLVGNTLLQLASASGRTNDAMGDAVRVLRSRHTWIDAPRTLRERVADLLSRATLEELLDQLDYNDDEATEELARHCARLVGWASWTEWNDHWARTPHDAGIDRRSFLTISLGADIAALGTDGDRPTTPPRLDEDGPARLEQLERALHGELLKRLGASPALGESPSVQVVACIDVRSEVLRRHLESQGDVETFGFAGFFGLTAEVEPVGWHERREALPVLLSPNEVIRGGVAPGDGELDRVALAGSVAELTHEPEAMFALAEELGWVAAPWLVVTTSVPRIRRLRTGDTGTWRLESAAASHFALGALRTMGLTTFAKDVVLLGHTARTAANTHFASYECGACAAHGGLPNAAALANILNDEVVRSDLREAGVHIPESTHFWFGEHDTTRDLVMLEDGAPAALKERFRAASVATNEERDARWLMVTGERRRSGETRARDVADTRPEWGLAGHVGFVIGPRASLRGVDLAGTCFMHSYDPTSDPDGEMLAFILSAPVVVAQWINSGYYFSSVAPGVLGAGDKTLLNPVGDFAVISGDGPDLALGLPDQALRFGSRPVHLPVRLLVAIEAPTHRIERAIASNELVSDLVRGEWLSVVARDDQFQPWRALRHGEWVTP